MLKALDGHTNTINTVAALTERGKIVSGSDDNTVRVWSMETGEVGLAAGWLWLVDESMELGR